MYKSSNTDDLFLNFDFFLRTLTFGVTSFALLSFPEFEYILIYFKVYNFPRSFICATGTLSKLKIRGVLFSKRSTLYVYKPYT